jgi:hypothetical protein
MRDPLIISSVWAAEMMQHALVHHQHNCYEQNEQNSVHLRLLLSPERYGLRLIA